MMSVLAGSARHGDGEDREVERNQNKGDKQAHEDQDGRFDERNHRAETQIYFIFIKFGDAGEHGRKSAAGFADFNHVEGEFGHDAGGRESRMERLAFANFLRGFANRALQEFAFDGFAGGLQAGDQGSAAGQKSGEGARELRNLKFENRFADERKLEFHAVHGNAAFFRAGPGEESDGGDEQGGDCAEDGVAIIHRQCDEDARGRGKRNLHVLIEQGKLRNDDGDKVGDDDARDGNEQHGIDERCENFFANAGADALVRDVIIQHAGKIAALFARQNRRRIHFGKNAGFGDGFRKRFAFAHAVAYLRNDGAETRRTGAFGEKIERAKNWEAGFDERIELLIEDQEIGAADLFAALAIEQAADKAAARLDGIDKQAAVRQFLAGFGVRTGGFHVGKDPPVGIRDPADEFAHSSQFTSNQTVAG